MQTSLIEEWVYALRKESNAHKGKVVALFALVTALVVCVGIFWQKHFEAGAVIYADEQNIIKPLLEGKASVTAIDSANDRLTVIRERIASKTILEQVIMDAKLLPDLDDKDAVARMVKALASGIVVSDAGRNHFRISFGASDADLAYLIASSLTSVFIRDSVQSKRAESREAFNFIDGQSKSYKGQLQQAEDRLKEFKGQYTDGPEEAVGERIIALRAAFEEQDLELRVARARRDELRSQLSKESQFINQGYKADVYRQRLNDAQSKLDTLRLSYQDTYPDIVALKYQISDLQRAISDVENDRGATTSETASANPVYQKLRTDLSDAEVTVRTLELRRATSERLLAEEQDRSKRVAEQQAHLAELTRDYDVTRQLYEDLLVRKERARMSMALDIEGQGITYRIKEPVAFPTTPVGLRFAHFFLAAPILGVLAPLGLLFAYVLLDPRIRFSDRLQMALPQGVPILAVVPHVSTPLERRVDRREWFTVATFVAVVLLAYVIVAAVRLMGVV